MDNSSLQFEEWFKKEYPLIESQPENTLLQSVKRQCHKAWQASRENLEVELPTKESKPSQVNSYAFGYNRTITE
ncbi:hypothetical protein EC835_101649 [Providencia alcalifaciens]|uniref:Uncharacterized protein n=1 Tax=Providencia alcalifaciens TaxID=126385 RepID=A0A4V2V4G6_9GAMM|nr:hypothetical protein [Providencia alcalifaciens]TCT38629.1 hypothetical protein EC835_101649 [Providencia alcalifaciens]